jgi:hypothetical protein
MNQDMPSATSNASGGLGAADGTSETVGFSTSHSFIVVSNLRTTAGADVAAADALHARPVPGDNVYRFRFLHDSDFSAPASDFQVVVNYKHDKMGTAGFKPALIQKQPDGSYLATLQSLKLGTYDIQVILSEGSLKDDEHDFQINL